MSNILIDKVFSVEVQGYNESSDCRRSGWYTEETLEMSGVELLAHMAFDDEEGMRLKYQLKNNPQNTPCLFELRKTFNWALDRAAEKDSFLWADRTPRHDIFTCPHCGQESSLAKWVANSGREKIKDNLADCPNCEAHDIPLANIKGHVDWEKDPLLWPESGERWTDKEDGDSYTVLDIANYKLPGQTNQAQGKHKSPVTVVYQGDNGRIWTKPVDVFLRTMSMEETSVRKPFTVQTLIRMLLQEDPQRTIIIKKDPTMLGHSPLSHVVSCAYQALESWKGKVGLESLTEECRSEGYTVEDVISDGEKALLLIPTEYIPQ